MFCDAQFRQGAPPDDVQQTRSNAAVALWRSILHLRKEPAMATSHAHHPFEVRNASGSDSCVWPLCVLGLCPSLC
jgi:hypothetical protein